MIVAANHDSTSGSRNTLISLSGFQYKIKQERWQNIMLNNAPIKLTNQSYASKISLGTVARVTLLNQI